MSKGHMIKRIARCPDCGRIDKIMKSGKCHFCNMRIWERKHRRIKAGNRTNWYQL
jgi:hypothetical protein